MPYYRRSYQNYGRGSLLRGAGRFVGNAAAGMLVRGALRKGWNYGRRRFNRGASLSSNYGTTAIAKRVSLRGFVNNRAELKYTDLAATVYAANSTGSIGFINAIAQGDDVQSRIGRQIICKWLELDGMVQGAQATGNANLCRLMVVWDKANNSSIGPAVTDILDAASSIAGYNLNNRERFIMLFDKTWTTAQYTATASLGETVFPIKVKVPINAKTTYSGTTATIGAIASGALIVFTIGNQAAGAGGQFQLHSRLRFTDA